MSALKNQDDEPPKGFNDPTALPHSAEQTYQWQEANRLWWENHPMRYDWADEIAHDPFTKQFYLEIDKRFFSDAAVYMPWQKQPFDPLIDFDSLADKDVLEIGVGSGSHAALLAQHARSFVGIDLTSQAVKSTAQRLTCFELTGKILQMDAESMEFEDSTFDFIWSWGVIHHSANTRQVLLEMNRVLKPGGQAIVMVYHRNFWNRYIMNGFFRGVLKGALLQANSLHQIEQRWTDGAIARAYTIAEWSALVSDLFTAKKFQIFGSKSHIVPLPNCFLKSILMKTIPGSISRFLTNHCQLGSFLVATLQKSG